MGIVLVIGYLLPLIALFAAAVLVVFLITEAALMGYEKLQAARNSSNVVETAEIES